METKLTSHLYRKHYDIGYRVNFAISSKIFSFIIVCSFSLVLPSTSSSKIKDIRMMFS